MKIGLLGLGTVGRAVLEAFQENRERIEDRARGRIEIPKALILHPERHGDHRDIATTNPAEILEDPEIEIVVEVMGGSEPARTYILQALRNGKSVVTANKEVLSSHGHALFQAAEAADRDLLFEGSVGAGIPIIRAVKIGLSGNRVQKIIGIVNGTTNFILTRMDQTGQTFEDALREAQEAGYAEADPTADVEGHDAARKAAILASIAFGSRVVATDVDRQGIARLTSRDIAIGRSFGWRLKHIIVAEEVDGRIGVRTHPAFLPEDHPLAAVNGIYNAVFVDALPLGKTMYYGPGAGGPSTASAILGDVVEAARNLRLGGRAVGCTCSRSLAIMPPEDSRSSFFLRLEVRDEPGVLSHITGLLAESGVSIRMVVQEEPVQGRAELVIVNHTCRAGDLAEALARLDRSPAVWKHDLPIRVEMPME